MTALLALSCFPEACSINLAVLSCWLAISNAPVPSYLVYCSSMPLRPAPSPGSAQGRTKATAVRASYFVLQCANAISIYSTPGSKIFPPITWSDIAAFAEGDNRPVLETNLPAPSRFESLGFSDARIIYNRLAPPSGPGVLLRYWEASFVNRRRDVEYCTERTNAPWAMVPLKPKELSRPADCDAEPSSERKHCCSHTTRLTGI